MMIQTKASTPVQAKTPNILDSQQVRHVTLGVTIDADLVRAVDSEKVLPIGTALAKVTATGLYCAARVGVLASSTATDAPTAVVDNASVFLAGDKVSIDGGAELTIQSINYDTNTITFTTNVGAVVAADKLVLGTGGTGTAVCMLYPDQADVTNGDGAFGAIDMARVIRSRLPVTHNTAIEAMLPHITFAD